MRSRVSVFAAIVAALMAVALVPAAGATPQVAHTLTIRAVPSQVNAGEGVLIYGRLTGPNNGDQTIYLYHRVNPAPTFTIIQRTKTDSTGFYEFVRAEGVVTTNRSWFARGPGNVHSPIVHEQVAPLLTLAASTQSATTRQKVIFAGSVSPDHRFERVLLQEQNNLAGNGWKTVASTFTNGSSQFVLSRGFVFPGAHTLRAYFPGDPRNIAGASDPVTVLVQQAQIPSFTIHSSAPIIPEGQSATITGVLNHANTEVTLYGKTANSGFVALGNTMTSGNGGYSFTVSPTQNTLYRVETTAAPKRHSAELFEGVQDLVTISPTSATAPVGGSVIVGGTVTPDKAGHSIYLQRLGSDNHWHNVAMGTVTTASTYSFTYTFGKMGTVQLRARIVADPDNIGAASPPVTINVMGLAPITSLPPAS